MRHHLFGFTQPFRQALLHYGDENVLLCLEMIKWAARMHPCRGGDVANRGTVEAFLAKQPGGDAQQFVAPVTFVVAARTWLALGFTHVCVSRGRSSGASISMRSSRAATALPRLSMRSERAAPPCSAALSTILIASRLSSG